MMKLDILIIDDEIGPRQSIRMILKDEHDVRVAENGPQGLDMAQKRLPDLVFLDLRMPGMSGIEVLQELKRVDTEMQVAIITAYAEVRTAQSAVRYGAVDYLTKPFAVNDVLEVVQRAAERCRRRHDTGLLVSQLAEATGVLRDQVQDAPGTSGMEAILKSLSEVGKRIHTEIEDVEHLRALGEAAAEMGHDLNNLLHVILLQIETLLVDIELGDAPPPENLRERLQMIENAARDASESTRRIKEYSKIANTPSERLDDLRPVVISAVDLSEAKQEADGMIEFCLEPVPPVMADETSLRAAVINLVNNAWHATDEKGPVRIFTRTEGDKAIIEVADGGKGMTAEVLANATNPFFSTKGDKGTGLGLSIVSKVVNQHGGELKIDSEEGRGTRVTIHLPAADRFIQSNDAVN